MLVLQGLGSQLIPGHPMDSKHVIRRLTFDGQQWTTAQTQGDGLFTGGRVGGAGKFDTFIPLSYGFSRCEQEENLNKFVYLTK